MSKTLWPKTHRLNREITCETGIQWLTVHKIIYRDLRLNCVKQRYTQQLSETNRVACLIRCKQLLQEIQFDFEWFRDEKCLPSNHHSTHRTIGFMHQLITRSDTSIPAVRYACRLWCPLPCHMWVWLNWYLSTMGWTWTASITAMSCCLSRCFQLSNVSQNVVYSQNNTLVTAKLVIFVFCDFPR